MPDLEQYQFKCEQCGACCRGEKGYIYLTYLDVMRAAEFLNVPVKEVLRRYAYYSKDYGQLFLKFPCKFQEGNKCSIYPARPIQCIAFPFWGELMEKEPLAHQDHVHYTDFCRPAPAFRPLKLLSADTVTRLKQIDDGLYNTDHLEVLVAMGAITEKDIQDVGFDWDSPKKCE